MSTTHSDRVQVAELSCGHTAKIAYNTSVHHYPQPPVVCHQCPGRPTVLVVDAMATYPMHDGVLITGTYDV